MPKRVCFLTTDTNGLHHTYKDVYSKNLFDYARLVGLYYMIGYYEKGKFVKEKKVSVIIKPSCVTYDDDAVAIHGITQENAMIKGKDVKKVIPQLKKDLSNVEFVIGHSLPFHLKSIQVELFRTCTKLEFNKYTCIDLMSYKHDLKYPKLQALKDKFKIKEKDTLKTIEKIFYKLYTM